ncbi:MAG: hypothetical protein ABI639_08130 [Thermoanaerobaculia bacterium]
MPARILMGASALFLAALGVAATFAPQEVWAKLEAGNGHPLAGASAAVLLLQVAGGLFLGFAILNWSTRDMQFGGIYNRPLLLGNFLHFVVVAMALLRIVGNGRTEPVLLVLAGAYTVFAVAFGWRMYRAPPRQDNSVGT